MKKVDLSFVVPAKNEQDSVIILYNEIIKEIKRLKKSYEIIFIDDGSTDKTIDNLRKIFLGDRHVKVYRLRGNFGKSVALQVGFEKSQGEIIFTLDADLQDNPSEISKFLEKISQGFDLVSGWKKKRHDPLTKVLPSRIFNYLTSLLTGVKIHDINCGFKAYKKEVVKNISIYGELYRFIPIFAAKQNYKIGEVIVNHRKRKFGQTKFGWERNIKGFLDLITIVFLTGYFRRPGHFFGTIGLVFLALGTVIGFYITYLRLTTGSIQFRHPLLFLGMLLIIVGIQLISTGLLAEMNLYNRERTSYDWAIKQKLISKKSNDAKK